MSLRRIAALATGETFGRGMAWLTVFTLPWILDTQQYGIVVLLATFEGVATGVLLLGQDSAIFWRCASYRDPAEGRDCVSGAMLITGTACFTALIGCSTTALLTGGTILGVSVWPHVWLLAIAVSLGNVNRIALAFARASGRTRAFVLDRGAVGAGRFAATLTLAGVLGSALSFPIGMAVGTAAGGMWLWRPFVTKGRWRGARREVRPLLRFGAPLSAHLLAMNTINLVDRWVIGAMLGLAAVGSYGWFYMLGSGVAFVYAALSVSYEPQIYREFQADRDIGSLREYLGMSIAAGGVYGIAGCVAASFAARLVPESVDADPAIAAIVLIAHWFRPMYLGATYLLSSVGRTARVAVISGMTVAATVAANLILIPRIGLVGGAWATLIGALMLALSGIVMLGRLSMPIRALAIPTAVVGLFAAGTLLMLDLTTFALGSVAVAIYGAHMSGLHERILVRLRPSSGHDVQSSR